MTPDRGTQATAVPLAAERPTSRRPSPAGSLPDLAEGAGFGHSAGRDVVVGQDFKAWVDADGVEFVPLLGDRAR